MSIFASYVTRTVTIPGEDPETVTIQKLTGKALAAARQVQITASMDWIRTMGGAAFQRELAAAVADGADAADGAVQKAVEKEREARQADPLRQYDRSTVLEKGVKAWTYQEPLTPDTLADLTDDAADFLAREILTLTLPNGNAQKKTPS